MMKKFFLTCFLCFAAGLGQAQVTGTVPPDYPAQASGSLDAQIEMVRRNYEDIQAKARAKLNREKAQERLAQESARKQRLLQEQKKEARMAELQKRADEKAELDMEMKRIEVRKAKSRAKLDEAIDAESIARVKDIVEAKIQGMKNR